MTGQPAISLPLFHGDDGLPLGVQLVGPPAGEEVLISLAAQLEEARPWRQRFSPMATGDLGRGTTSQAP
jgi:amidase